MRTLLVRLGQSVSKLWKSCRPSSTARGRGHRRDVERPANVPAIAKLKRTGERAVVDHVSVAFGPGVRASRERPGVVRGHRARGHRRGNRAFKARTNRLGRVARSCQEMDRLRQRVHAGVGAAARRSWRLVRRSTASALLRGPAESFAGRLALPAVEVGAVVGESELDVPHRPVVSSVKRGRARARGAFRRSGRRWWRLPCGGCR